MVRMVFKFNNKEGSDFTSRKIEKNRIGRRGQKFRIALFLPKGLKLFSVNFLGKGLSKRWIWTDHVSNWCVRYAVLVRQTPYLFSLVVLYVCQCPCHSGHHDNHTNGQAGQAWPSWLPVSTCGRVCPLCEQRILWYLYIGSAQWLLLWR